MTAFGMIQRQQDGEGGPSRIQWGSGGGVSIPRAAPRPIQKRFSWAPKGPLVIQKSTTPVPFVNRPGPDGEAIVNRLPPVVVDAPDPVSLATSFQLASPIPATNSAPDTLPPILPADVASQPKAAGTKAAGLAGFFDQELIPGVKNLYLAGGVGALLLLLLLMRKK